MRRDRMDAEPWWLSGDDYDDEAPWWFWPCAPVVVGLAALVSALWPMGWAT